MNPINLSQMVLSIPRTSMPLEVSSHLEGARVFHAACETDRVWVAELTRFTGNSVLGNNLFASADGKAFSQLRVTDCEETCIQTETPGLGSVLAVYDETDLNLFLGKSENTHSAVRYSLQRIPARDLLSSAVFYGLPRR